MQLKITITLNLEPYALKTRIKSVILLVFVLFQKSVYEKMLQQSKKEMKSMECRLKVNITQLQQALEKYESELEDTKLLLKVRWL